MAKKKGVVRSKHAAKARRGSQLEQSAALQLLGAGLGGYRREGYLLAPRRFRFDFYWPKEKVALEVHGVYGQKSRHRTAKGFQQDRVKMNLLQLEGWVVLEAGTDHVKTGEFLEWVRSALKSRR